jgi:hypothetical protein
VAYQAVGIDRIREHLELRGYLPRQHESEDRSIGSMEGAAFTIDAATVDHGVWIRDAVFGVMCPAATSQPKTFRLIRQRAFLKCIYE